MLKEYLFLALCICLVYVLYVRYARRRNDLFFLEDRKNTPNPLRNALDEVPFDPAAELPQEDDFAFPTIEEELAPLSDNQFSRGMENFRGGVCEMNPS